MSDQIALDFAYQISELILAFIAILLVLRIVWRVEKKLDLFFKLLAAGFIMHFVGVFVEVLNELQIISSRVAAWNLFEAAFYIAALVIMSSEISRLDNEK